MVEPVVLRLGFVNAYLLRGDALVLVDCGYPGSAAAVVAAVRDAGEDPARLSLVIATHGHHDHYGAAADLRRMTGAPIACSDRDAAELEAGENRFLEPAGAGGFVASLFASRFPAGRRPPWAVEPDVLFSGPADLSRWGVDASVVPCAGHIPGSLAVVPSASAALAWSAPEARGGVPLRLAWAIAGDLAMGRLASPRRPRLPFFVQDPLALAASLRAFSRTDRVHLGHGGPVRGADLEAIALAAEREAAQRGRRAASSRTEGSLR